MPSFRKLSPAEVAALDRPPIGARAEIARMYDAYLADFAVGEYGRADLLDGERRTLVRQRLQAAARRRGVVLHFRFGPGPLIFQVAAVPVCSVPPSQEPSASISIAPAGADRRSPRPPRPPRQRQSAAERYRDVLPRWMRTGQHGSRQNGRTKRRPR